MTKREVLNSLIAQMAMVQADAAKAMEVLLDCRINDHLINADLVERIQMATDQLHGTHYGLGDRIESLEELVRDE